MLNSGSIEFGCEDSCSLVRGAPTPFENDLKLLALISLQMPRSSDRMILAKQSSGQAKF
jgi:hypothetical protein